MSFHNLSLQVSSTKTRWETDYLRSTPRISFCFNCQEQKSNQGTYDRSSILLLHTYICRELLSNPPPTLVPVDDTPENDEVPTYGDDGEEESEAEEEEEVDEEV